MSCWRRVPDDERQRIRDLFAAGMSCREAGALHGCSDKTVRRIVGEDPKASRAMRRYREDKRGVDTTEIATLARLREVDLRPEPVNRPCPATVLTARGREVCGACGGKGYLRSERARRRA